MQSAQSFAHFIRRRQADISNMDAASRRATLASDLKASLRDAPRPEKEALLKELQGFFPTGMREVEDADQPSPAAQAELSVETALKVLERAADSRPQSDRRAFQIQIANRLEAAGILPAAPEPAGQIKGSDFLEWLRQQAANMPKAEWLATRAQVAEVIGVGLGGGQGATADRLIGVLQEMKETMLSNPEPTLSEHLKAFSRDDIKGDTGLRSLVDKLRRRSGGVAKFLWQRFQAETQGLVVRFQETPAERKRLAEALEKDLGGIVGGQPIYEEQRFHEVDLSPETRRLLALDARDERQRIRLNQALLENAFPSEILCQTSEREIIDGLIECLSKLQNPDVSVEALAKLAMASLVELGCTEQFGRMVLMQLDKDVFDDVHGLLRLGDKNNLNALFRRLLESKSGSASFVQDIRRYMGLIKSLLLWYPYSCGLSAKPIADLNPDGFEKAASRSVLSMTIAGAVDYRLSWEAFSRGYQSAVSELCGNSADIGADLTEATIRKLINKTIERKVSRYVLETYNWTPGRTR